MPVRSHWQWQRSEMYPEFLGVRLSTPQEGWENKEVIPQPDDRTERHTYKDWAISGFSELAETGTVYNRAVWCGEVL